LIKRVLNIPHEQCVRTGGLPHLATRMHEKELGGTEVRQTGFSVVLSSVVTIRGFLTHIAGNAKRRCQTNGRCSQRDAPRQCRRPMPSCGKPPPRTDRVREPPATGLKVEGLVRVRSIGVKGQRSATLGRSRYDHFDALAAHVVGHWHTAARTQHQIKRAELAHTRIGNRYRAASQGIPHARYSD
jgi:hypothetical protein